MTEEFIWDQKYRPKTIDEVIIPDHIKQGFRQYILDKEIPNILLNSSSPGTGKTTMALALCNELGVSPFFINASVDNSINDIRNDVMQYATTCSMFSDSKKIIIMDEMDKYSISAQDGLKGIIEKVSKNCRFIGTCNTISRLTDPILSRLTVIDFAFSTDDLKTVKAKMFKRCQEILTLENIPYKDVVLAKLVAKYVPDNRKLIGVLQQFAAQYGAIDEGALGVLSSCDTDVLMSSMKDGKYGIMKDWVFENAGQLSDDFYMKLFKTMEQKITPQSIPHIILTMGEYQKYHSVVPDRTIHFLAMLTEIMSDIKFKE